MENSIQLSEYDSHNLLEEIGDGMKAVHVISALYFLSAVIMKEVQVRFRNDEKVNERFNQALMELSVALTGAQTAKDESGMDRVRASYGALAVPEKFKALMKSADYAEVINLYLNLEVPVTNMAAVGVNSRLYQQLLKCGIRILVPVRQGV